MNVFWVGLNNGHIRIYILETHQVRIRDNIRLNEITTGTTWKFILIIFSMWFGYNTPSTGVGAPSTVTKCAEKKESKGRQGKG